MEQGKGAKTISKSSSSSSKKEGTSAVKDPTATPQKKYKVDGAVKEEKGRGAKQPKEEREPPAKDLLPKGSVDVTILFFHQSNDSEDCDRGIKKTLILDPGTVRSMLSGGLAVQLKFDLGSEKAENGEWFRDVKEEISRLRRCQEKSTEVIYLHPATASTALATSTHGKSKAAIQARERELSLLLVPMRHNDNSYVELLGDMGKYPALREVVFSHKGELFAALTNLVEEASTSDDDRQMQAERARIPLVAALKKRADQEAIKRAFEAEGATTSSGAEADISKVEVAGSSTDIATNGAGSSTDLVKDNGASSSSD